MLKYHAVMLDETRCEFGVTFEAASREEAYDYLDEMYPESRVDELKTHEEWDRKRHDMEQHIYNGGDWDDEGRPIHHYAHDEDADY